MKIWVDVTWSLLYNGTSGSAYRGTGLAFDTQEHTIAPYTADVYVALFDAAPGPVHRQSGEVIYYECAPDFTQTSYVLDGGTQLHVVTEADSAACGWTPPLSCDLGAASVSQQATASGAKLTARFDGTSNGPVLYSLDGGPEQTSPLFAQVAPGAHEVKVRDQALAGCERVVHVQVAAPPVAPTPPAAPTGAPVGIDFVRQPLFYALDGQAAGATVTLELWAESTHYRGDYHRVATSRKVADVTGAVAFRLDRLLLPLLAAWVPPPGLTIDQVSQACAPNLLNYYVRTTSLAPAAGALPDYGIGELRAALRGGLPPEWQSRDFFAFRQTNFDLPPFLSWQPTGPGLYAAGRAKAVVPRQPEWLCWLCPAEVAGQQLRVRRAYRMAGSDLPVVDYEPVATPAGGWGLRLLAIPLKDARAGFAQLGIQVETLAGDALSPEALFHFEEAGPRTRFVQFTNSLGGLDTLRCTGRLDYALETVAEAVELPQVAPAGGVPLADRRVGELTATRKLKLATGWLTPAQLDWLQELVLSRELWQVVAGQPRPLDAGKRSLTPYADEPGLRGLLLEFDYAYAATTYAPVPYA